MTKITAKDIYGKEYKVDSELLQMRISIYGISEENGKALVLPCFDGYDWPGGTVEKGENHIVALKREYKEETGLDIMPTDLASIYTSLFKSPHDNYYHCLLIYYFVRVIGGDISTSGFTESEKDYAEKARWIPLSELCKMRIACNLNIGEKLLDIINLKKTV